MHRSSLLLLFGAFCAGGVVLITEPEAGPLMEREAQRFQGRVDRMGIDLFDFVQQQAQFLASSGARPWMAQRADELEAEWNQNGTTLCAFAGDSLVAWSGDLPIEPGVLLETRGAHARIGNSIWLCARVSIGSLKLFGLRPVWNSPPVTNRYLGEGFHRSLDAPNGLRAGTLAGEEPVIKDANGQAMFTINWSEGALEMGQWLVWRAILMVLAAAFVITALWRACLARVKTGAHLSGALLFLVGLMALRWGTIYFGTTAPMDRWPLFDPAIYATSSVFPSLGDLLINAMLLVVGAAFIRCVAYSIQPVRSTRSAFLLVGLVLLHGAWVTRLCIVLVNDSSIDLDLYHVQGIGAFGLLALLSMALLWGSWCLLAASVVQVLLTAERSGKVLWASVIVFGASVVAHHWFGVVDTILFLWPVPLIALFVLGRYRRFTFLFGVLALGLLSLTTTHILTKYMHNREQRERVVLAERLAAREDPVVEQLFREKAPQLRHDRSVHDLLTRTAACGANELEAIVQQPYFSGYWERYDVRLFGYGPQGDLRCATDLEPPRSFADGPAHFPSGVSDMPDLFIDERSGGDIFYHARIAVMPTDSSAPAQLIVEATPRSLSQGLGFPELLLAGDDDVARRTERYVQARYVNGMLMDRNDRAPPAQHWERTLNEDGESWYTEGGFDLLAKAVGSSTIMVLGLPHRGVIDKATTFSYLFAFFGLLALLTLAAQALVAGSVPSLGIGTKVRAALVLFAITGLVFFGIGSQRLLSRQFTQRSEAASLEKARAVQLELQRRLGDERIAGEANTAYLEHLLGQLSNTFFTDITVYAPDGRLLASSRPQMFSTGLLGQRMNPVAYARLAIEGRSAFVHEESVGKAAFRTAYVPLLDHKGDVLAHIALPRFADQVQQEEERSELLVAVVNLFVLLFALSVLLAVFISNWTTHPLDLLKRSLAGVALQGANEPIRYRGKDEVGELVAVYNRKVYELRESAEKLAQSERESAWKEMARQVAHEIKNPLTPMKLGIQHFQRSWDPQAPDAKEKLDRFSASMVEQIDTLSRVAGDFSRFAQMSAAHETVLDLNEVARSSVALLAGEPNADIALHLSTPLMVRADREHLLRVFNNLLKNALQAVPDERRGRIEVVAREDEGRAIIEVRDNGTGIPEEVRAHIFEPSFTTKSSGMGLGLAMVKRMVEQAHGSVRFDTRVGEGTTFFVTLPLVSSH